MRRIRQHKCRRNRQCRAPSRASPREQRPLAPRPFVRTIARGIALAHSRRFVESDRQASAKALLYPIPVEFYARGLPDDLSDSIICSFRSYSVFNEHLGSRKCDRPPRAAVQRKIPLRDGSDSSLAARKSTARSGDCQIGCSGCPRGKMRCCGEPDLRRAGSRRAPHCATAPFCADHFVTHGEMTPCMKGSGAVHAALPQRR